MRRHALLALFGFPWMFGGGPPDSGLLSCHGQFGEFANGQLSAVPSELNFVVDWGAPTIFTETGRPARIIALTPISASFEVQYTEYRATYWVNRRDGSIAEISNLGGKYWGECEMRPLTTRF